MQQTEAEREVIDAEARYMCNTGKSPDQYETECVAQCSRVRQLLADRPAASRELYLCYTGKSLDQHESECTTRCKQTRELIVAQKCGARPRSEV